MAGKVIYKEQNPKLALAMWPPDEHGQPWSYTFFLNNLRYFKIPLSHFNLVSGYRFTALMGFQEIKEPHQKEILSHYKDFDTFFDTFSDNESAEIPKADERVYINVDSQVKPQLSTKTIVSYQPVLAFTPSGRRRSKFGYVDFDEINKHRAKLGSLGEEVVLRFERDFLRSKGRSDLAERVRQISLENTYAGYDIISFTEDGKEKRIEVKATSIEQQKSFSFNISKNEKLVAESSENYFIYLVYAVNTQSPKIHVIENPFKTTDHLTIEPTNFIVKGGFADK
jgi:hypothetical protein